MIVFSNEWNCEILLIRLIWNYSIGGQINSTIIMINTTVRFNDVRNKPI